MRTTRYPIKEIWAFSGKSAKKLSKPPFNKEKNSAGPARHKPMPPNGHTRASMEATFFIAGSVPRRYNVSHAGRTAVHNLPYFLPPSFSNSRSISSAMLISFLIALSLLLIMTTLLHRKIRIREKNRKLMTQRNFNSSSSMRVQCLLPVGRLR